MRILQVIPTYLPAVRHGGPVRAVHGLARELVARGHRVVVYTTNRHGNETLDVPIDRATELDGVSVRYFPVQWPRRLARSPALGRELARTIGGFDVVHVHSLFLWPGAVAARAARRARIPYLVSPRGMLVRDLFARRGRLRKAIWLRWIDRPALEGAARIVVTTALEAEEVQRFRLRLPPVVELPNGVDAASAPAATGTGRDPARFVFLGRLSWKKGLEALVEAVAAVPGIRVVLAGNDEEGMAPALRDLARRKGVADRVELAGFVDGEAKSALLAGSRALVLPSISENFGNVVLEAWALGVPAIVTPGVGLAGEVEACGGGMVASPGPAGLAAALERLAGDAELARSMGENGRRRALERYSWPAVAERAERIYGEVLEERGRRAG